MAARGEHKKSVLSFDSDAVLQSIVGPEDSNFKSLANKLDINIGRAPGGVSIEGQDADVNLAVDLLTQLQELVKKGEKIFPGDMERAITLLSANRKAKLEDLFREQISISGRNKQIVPKTLNQKIYIEAIRNNNIIFGVGPAGTGKTYLAMAMAVSALLSKKVKRVVLCRPAVEAGEKLGFLPGDMSEKVNPYLRPLYDALHDMVDPEKAEEMVEKGLIEVAPLAFMRGRTLSRAFVILDEAQNTSEGQMKMLLTRLGEGSQCVVTGDITQIDLPRGVRSGLVQALSVLKNIDGIARVDFEGADVIRHKVVAAVIAAYERANKSRQ